MTNIVHSQARQGDVCVTRATAVPTGSGVDRDNGRVVLAYGEVTGHAHAFRDPGVCLLRAEGITMLTVTPDGALLEHEEHVHIPFGGGTYEVRIQQQWDWSAEVARNVRD